MPKLNQYSELLRAVEPSAETKQRGDDAVIAPFENAIAEIDDLIRKLDADVGDSAMNVLREYILKSVDIPPSTFAKYNELLVKDLLHVKHRLETSYGNYRAKRQESGVKETA